MTKYLIALAAAATLAACNTSTEGAYGNLAFTPMDCGLLGCDLDDSIGVGGVIQLQISGLEGISTAGATMVSDAPNSLSVIPVEDFGGQPTWELQALAAGVPSVTVYSASDEILDFVEIPTQELTGIVARNVLGDAVGPADDPNYDEVWTVNAGQDVAFQMTPVIGLGVPTMGKYSYIVTLDAGLEDGLLDSDVAEGYLHFNVVAGDYLATFENDWGHTINVLISAQGAN